MSVLRRARSLCPHCLRRVDAVYRAYGEDVYLEKSCPEHGAFSTPAWLAGPGAPAFSRWRNPNPPGEAPQAAASAEKGCPFDCGLCPEHAQRTCCALVEVTKRCDMNCPVCYASAGEADASGAAPYGRGSRAYHSRAGRAAVLPVDDPPLSEIRERLCLLLRRAGPANVQLSGGEPTMRDDLPQIIGLARSMGFPFVQLNTNGLRLARESGYARLLKEAGLNLAYLQWDGLQEKTFITMRGAPYLAEKEAAARNCVQAGLSVLIVATVARGVNDGELGALLRKALSFGPHVRGLHLQPVALFGRHPWLNHAEGAARENGGPCFTRADSAQDSPRLTLPELMLALERQSGGMLRAKDFHPPSSEHELCSFSALYQRRADGGLSALPTEPGCCGPHQGDAERARDFVARHWGEIAPESAVSSLSGGFEAFIAQSGLRQRFTVSAMAFQDIYNLDLNRLRRCHIHVAAADGRLVPFCACNLTSASGMALYR